MKRYSVSLVYQRRSWFKTTIWLQVYITDASNEDEALGKAINDLSEETKGYSIINKIVLPTDAQL